MSVTLDWLLVKGTGYPPIIDLNKILDITGPARADSSNPLYGRFVLVELTIANPSSVTAKDIDIHFPDAALAYDNKSTPPVYKPKRPIHLDTLLPKETRAIYLVFNNPYGDDFADEISVIVAGLAVPVTLANAPMFLLPGIRAFNQLLYNSVAVQLFLTAWFL